jgi:hypothetical protein
MMTDTGSIAYAAPSDIKYAEFIQKIVLQCMIHMDSYLRKSVYLYYNVREDQDKKDTGTKALTITIFMQVKGLLDSHIIGLIEKTEKALMPTGVPFIQAVKKLGTMEDIEILLQTHQKPPTSPKFSSPDGTGVITNL